MEIGPKAMNDADGPIITKLLHEKPFLERERSVDDLAG
jgi:hypothetical protein